MTRNEQIQHHTLLADTNMALARRATNQADCSHKLNLAMWHRKVARRLAMKD